MSSQPRAPFRLVLVALTATALATPAFGSPSETEGVRVDLNSAPTTVLVTLPGIGPKRAAQIVARRSRRPFRRLRDLLRIRGIGPRTLRKIAERAEVRRAPYPPPASDRRSTAKPRKARTPTRRRSSSKSKSG